MSIAPIESRSKVIDRDSQVYERIYQSVLEHRLPPGTKLPEEKLAAIFEVTRARIRKVLARLEVEGIIETVPNRGAFIVRPTFDESEDIFEMRRALEPAIVRRLTQRASTEDIEILRKHVAAEFRARDVNDERAMIRLTGEFHITLADLAGNRAMARPMRELTALTCLAILLYNAASSVTCRADEHAQLIDRIQAGDHDTAVSLMLDHLEAIRRNLSFPNPDGMIDLEAALSEL